LLVDPDVHAIVGNLAGWTATAASLDRPTTQRVIRDGRASSSRVLARRLPNGATLVVGRDLSERQEIEQLVWRALLLGGAIALLLAIGGAALFRRQLERRVGAIRRTALEVTAGDLSRRIPISGVEDEFARLNRDINRMLDQFVHLMHGVRDVSNAIAHDLRTPLGRIRGQLDEALRLDTNRSALVQAARRAIHDIDELIGLFEKVLQIAESESGMRRETFEPVPLNTIITDMVELYNATAEAHGIVLRTELHGDPTTRGDKNLLATAVANLIDNAVKYAGRGATVGVWATEEEDTVSVVVQDNGPGIPPEERPRVVERFYRLDRSRSLPGHGLGLSIVRAIASLHRGTLSLDDAAPGLVACLILPQVNAISFPKGNTTEMQRKGSG
jgi:signal transduction histidine kinase